MCKVIGNHSFKDLVAIMETFVSFTLLNLAIFKLPHKLPGTDRQTNLLIEALPWNFDVTAMNENTMKIEIAICSNEWI